MMEKAEKINKSESNILDKIFSSKFSFVIISLIFIGAIVMTMTASKSISLESSASGSVSNLQVVGLHGQQPIKKGCANFYGSDWHIDPHTAVVVVCETLSLDYKQIQKDGLGQNAPNHGISFVETGDDVSVTLSDTEGNYLNIPESNTVWLNFKPYGKDSSWNDRTKELSVLSGNSILGVVNGVQAGTSKSCATLYATSPLVNPHTYALIACCQAGQTVDYTQDYIQDHSKEFGGITTLKDMSLGTSYVSTGNHVAITLYDGPACDKPGEYDNKLTIKSSSNVDLLKVMLSGKDQTRTWNDVALSFTLQCQ